MKQLTASGSSQESLAKKLGVSQSSVTQWIRGENCPKQNRIEAFMEAFSVSADYFTNPSLGPDPDFRAFPARRADSDNAEWSAFAQLHASSLSQLGDEAAGWIRNAPFRGGMPDQSAGWALALSTALSLQRLGLDTKMGEDRSTRPAATQLIGRKK